MARVPRATQAISDELRAYYSDVLWNAVEAFLARKQMEGRTSAALDAAERVPADRLTQPRQPRRKKSRH